MEHQIGSLAVTLGGKTYTLFFDYAFVSVLQTMFGSENFQEVVAKDPFRLIPAITLAAIKAGDDVNDLTDLPTEKQISRLLFAAGGEVNKSILDNYNTSMGFIGAVYAQVAQTANAVEKGKGTKK